MKNCFNSMAWGYAYYILSDPGLTATVHRNVYENKIPYVAGEFAK